jgi:hypothetical protein
MGQLPLGGRYQPDRILATHDAVKTWRGRDVVTGEDVIIKMLDVGRAGSSQEVELFERQGNVLSQLQHPSIPQVRAVLQEEVDGRPTLVLVTQFVDGRDLEAAIRSGKSLDERGILKLGVEAAQILEFLHARLPPLVHRDVKPANLMQDKEGALHLVDFGSVKLPSSSSSSSRGATVVGTFGYMPPEQFEGAATPASDVHALGMTLLYLATHKHPWEHGEGGPRAAMTTTPGLSSGFRALLRRMTEPEPRARYANGEQARVALEELLAPRRSKAPLWAAVGMGLVLASGGGAVVMFAPRETPPHFPTTPPPPVKVQQIYVPPPVENPVMEKPPMFFPAAMGEVHRCYMRAVPRILQSRWRYRSWLTGGREPPTGQERYISYGLYEGYDDAVALCAAASENAPASMRQLVQEVSGLTREAIPLLKRANKYYDEARYKDDDAKGARELHGPLMEVFDGMLSAGLKLEEVLLREGAVVLRDAAIRHQDRPIMARAVALFTAYHQVAVLSPPTSADAFNNANLLAALNNALDLSDALEADLAAAHETLSNGEKQAVDNLVGCARVARTVARQLREGNNRRSDEGKDPLKTRELYLDAVTDIHVWAESNR